MLIELDGVEIMGQARTVADAVSAIRRHKPDLLIQDVQTADGSGLIVLTAIKQSARPPLVIVLTNDAYPPYRKAYLPGRGGFLSGQVQRFQSDTRAITATIGCTSGP